MIYQISDSIWPWLFPAMALTGLICEFLAIFVAPRALLLAGLALGVAGAIGDRDLTLGIGVLATTGGIWFFKER